MKKYNFSFKKLLRHQIYINLLSRLFSQSSRTKRAPITAPPVFDTSVTDSSTFCFPIPVCGGYYVEQFLRYCLPSLLAPGNFPYLATQGVVRLIITTTKADQAVIEASPIWQIAAGIVKVQFDLVTEYTPGVMTRSHNYGLQAYPHAYVFFLVADIIMPERGLASLYDAITPNIAAIQCVALRAELYKIRAALEQYRQGEVLNIPQQHLNKISLGAIDPTTYWRDIDGPVFTRFPSILLQRNESVMCARFFHFHLIMIKNQPGMHIAQGETFDARFLGRVVTNPDNILTISDINTFFIASTVQDFFSYPDEAHRTGGTTGGTIVNTGKTAMIEVACWARQCMPQEWNNFRDFKVILGEYNPDHKELLSQDMVHEIEYMGLLFMYFSEMTPHDISQHNGQLQVHGSEYVIVDNLTTDMWDKLPRSKELVSIDGLSNIHGRYVLSLREIANRELAKGQIFLWANSQSQMYLKKMLMIGIPVHAFYTSKDLEMSLKDNSQSLVTTRS